MWGVDSFKIKSKNLGEDWSKVQSVKYFGAYPMQGAKIERHVLLAQIIGCGAGVDRKWYEFNLFINWILLY